MRNCRSHLKKVFSPELGVEPSSQVLDILEYACGLRLGLALISDENPNFEIAYSLPADIQSCAGRSGWMMTSLTGAVSTVI